MKKQNLIGKKFNYLTVIKEMGRIYDTNKSIYWECKCDCGNITRVSSGNLTSGAVKSCGCLVSSSISKFNKKTKTGINTYDLTGIFGIGYTQNGEEFYFDLEDYDKIKNYYWRFNDRGNDKGYLYTKVKNKVIFMHRLLTSVGKKNDVDHQNHKTNDNRKENLRICDESQNGRNSIMQINNTSGVTGVSWHKHQNKWVAYITITNKRITLGYFNNFEDAVKTRKDAEEKYFGEWSYENSTKIK